MYQYQKLWCIIFLFNNEIRQCAWRMKKRGLGKSSIRVDAYLNCIYK